MDFTFKGVKILVTLELELNPRSFSCTRKMDRDKGLLALNISCFCEFLVMFYLVNFYPPLDEDLGRSLIC